MTLKAALQARNGRLVSPKSKTCVFFKIKLVADRVFCRKIFTVIPE